MKLKRRGEQDTYLRILFKIKLDVIVVLREPLQVNCVSLPQLEGIN